MFTDLPHSPPDEQLGSKEAGSRSSERQSGIVPLDILIILLQRKGTILLITLGFAVPGGAISLVLPKKYTSTVSLFPPQQNSSLGNAFASQIGNLGGIAALARGSLGIMSPNEMYVAMLRSRTVEDAMVQRFGLMQEYHSRLLPDARKNLEHNTKIEASGKDSLIHISVKDRNPEHAAALANGYLDQFRKLSENLAIAEAAQRRLFFQQQLQGAKNQLAAAEEALEQAEQRTGLIQLDSQARALIESVASLRAQISAKEVQIQSMQTLATDQNAQVVRAQQELDSLRAELTKLRGAGEKTDADLILPQGRVPTASLEYVRKLRDAKYYETIFDIMARQFELAKPDEAKEGALIQDVGAAVPADRRSSPYRTLIVIGAAVFGFFFGVFYALLLSSIERISQVPAIRTKFLLIRHSLAFRKAHGLG
jgi:uncharacterized protein involved in exopolysaccharide biosynthesis